jgi:hypothetical protein
VVVLGSAYRQVDLTEQPRNFVDAFDELSAAERNQLARLVEQFSGGLTVDRIGPDRNVLAALYRTLPASRLRLTVGLSREARAAEDVLRRRGEATVPRKVSCALQFGETPPCA